MKTTTKQKQEQLLKNLINCLNKNTPFDQVGKVMDRTLGTKPITHKHPFSQPKSTSANKLIKNKKNKA